MNMAKWVYTLWVLGLMLQACDPSHHHTDLDQGVSVSDSGFLFDILSDSVTNINFNNTVRENAVMNGFAYEYLYNGAGVSVGDLNGDDLPDLYFAANLVDNQLYVNKGDLKFQDVTRDSGVKGTYGFYQGTTMVDINGDGKLDIYSCKSGIFKDPDKRRNELYINTGNNAAGVPVFKEEAKRYGLDLPHHSTQASFFDFDRDGDLDLFLLNHNVTAQYVQENMERLRFEKSELTSDRLFRNDEGKFIDISDEAGIINNGIGFGLGVAIGDLNNDGWPDILVGQDYTAKDRLYLNQKDGTYREVISDATGHISTFSMGNDIADFNNDGWLDFISVDMVSEDNYGMKASMSGMNPEQFTYLVENGFHHQYMYNTLQMNNGTVQGAGQPLFSDIAAFGGISNTDWSWGPLFFDMDNDGDKDLFVSNGIKRDFRNVDYTIYKNKKHQALEGKLARAPEKLRKSLYNMFVEDMLRKMPERKKDNYFFENKGDLSFSKKNKIWAPDKLTATNGAAYADLDNDGDLDIITNNMDDKAFIYRNNSVEKGLGNYIKIKLVGASNNPDGIGARVMVQTKEGRQIAEQYFSRGFQSSVDRVLHFGLGHATEIQVLTITWPDGSKQALSGLPVNELLVLDHSEAVRDSQQPEYVEKIFENITQPVGLRYKPVENEFDDFVRESLLPHKLSEDGPAMAVGDVNNDGFEDFYMGGAKGFTGKLYLQNSQGKFYDSRQVVFTNEQEYEDVDATFFDIDMDDDLDLYVVSGGNEHPPGSPYYADRVYLNEKGSFTKAGKPFEQVVRASGSVVRPYDYDLDGDLDLFVGGRQIPGKYPYPGKSFLLRNDSKKDNIRLVNVMPEALKEVGMVTDATWSDIDRDGTKDLIVVGEWMPVKILKNKNGELSDFTEAAGLSEETGWWFSVESADYDRDGDMDLVAGNLGLNAKYKASKAEPFEIYTKDFDQTGTLDIVLGFHQDGKVFPLRGRSCSSNQMPFLKKKFPTYHAFAMAGLEEVYGGENMKNALHYNATNFASCYFENKGNGVFDMKILPNLAQITTVRRIISDDINKDGNLDIVLFGNMYGFEVETPRQDAGYGLYLTGDGKGNFTPLMPYDSGLCIKGNVSDAGLISAPGGRKVLGVARNNDFFQIIAIN